MDIERKGHFPDPDIFARKYNGQTAHIQEGKFHVHAATIRNGEPTGGGLVASFNKEEDAQACVEEINGVNPKHDAKIDTGKY
ncbi:hypothetical protein KKF04_04750 [Patescibacteria group bacterium]|nr:hypothetical protein [Nanoarchaeota archaeon]MBU1935339.1 hypothetical protein [Patescibacteria group bacterium]